MKTSVLTGSVLFISFLVFSSVGWAQFNPHLHHEPSGYFVQATLSHLPINLPCLNNSHESMNYNNEQVMQWKHSTPDQFLARGFITGVISNLLPDHTQHTHFGLNIDQYPGPDIEVIYNDEFGALPKLSVGMQVVACGDYITIGPDAQEPSPYGAIIHWIHYNPGTRDGGKHPSGFVIINGHAFGTPPNTLKY